MNTKRKKAKRYCAVFNCLNTDRDQNLTFFWLPKDADRSKTIMTWYMCLILLSILNFSYCINRPVFKIVLTQKGFTQFLQYDVETPPIREFTFCTWLRVFDLSHDQSVFTYVANGNNRVIQLWLDSGGKFMKISLNGRTFSSTLVDITENTWRHVCLSYQADFGAWAIYLDGRLASCEAAQSIYGFILPGGGSVIIGYGTTDSGIPNGLEGEIFGANMILKSTIERNFTIKRDPQYQQKFFHKNKLLGSNNIKYVVLNDMNLDTIPDNSETTNLPILNTTRSFIRFKSTHGLIEHDVGLDLIPKKTKKHSSNEKEILDFTRIPDVRSSTQNNEKINFWNLLNEAGNIGKFKGQISKAREQSGSGTQELPTISEYETPPPPVSFYDYTRSSVKIKKPVLKTSFETKENHKSNSMKINNDNKYEVSEVVKPPPYSKNTKVYGQWTGYQFANSVLNYLKNTNFENRKLKKVPSTIPLLKISDTFPYASDYKVTKVQPFKFERRNFKTANIIQKRDITYPQINVQIFKDDIRTEILESHAKAVPKNVEIINRGQTIKNNKYHRFYRNVDNQISSETSSSSEVLKPTPFAATPNIYSKTALSNSDLYKNSNLMAILPFLKSAEYFVDEYVDIKSINSNEMYTKSLSNANKWHNVKSYNNDYTPRRINMESGEIISSIDKDIDTGNKKHPSIRLKYRPENHKVVKNNDDAEILNGRNLALEISNLSNTNPSSISILKYNHGFLPDSKITKSTKMPDSTVFNDSRNKKVSNENNFNKNIKIGNALNERYIIGDNAATNKISFVGGLDKIPDINRYRSDIDHVTEIVPPSLGPKVCKNVELYDRLLYVQPDGSVDVTHILSPVKEKNLGIEFIVQNYKKCSLEESMFETNALLFIDWSKTPVRLFGGSYPKKTTDLCGFF